MFGVGATELGIIAVIATLLLFAPTLMAFWLGYLLGTKKSAPAPEPRAVVPPVEPAPVPPAEQPDETRSQEEPAQ